MLFVPFYLLILLAATSELVVSNDHNSVNAKLFDKSAEEAFWFEQFRNVEPERSRDVKLDEFICELSKKQRMLETIFEPKNNYPHSNEPFSMNEYKFLKSRKNSIHHKDPALSQVLDYLFVAQMSAKRTMQSLPDYFYLIFDMDDGFLTIKTLRQRVGYALVFLSKRHRIQLDKPREHFVFTKSVQKHFVQELINFLDQAKKCSRRVNKKGQSCANECANESEGNNSNKKRQFFQFAVKTIGIDWDGSAFSNRQKNANRRRRRRRTNFVPSISFAFLLLFVIIFIIIICMLCNDAIQRTLNARNRQNQTAANASIIALSQANNANAYLDAFKAIPPSIVAKQQENAEQTDCAICLASVDFGTTVKPLPICKHFFHTECIEMWIQGGHNACPICRQEILISSTTTSHTENDVENQLSVVASNGTMQNSLTETEENGTVEQMIIQDQTDHSPV